MNFLETLKKNSCFSFDEKVKRNEDPLPLSDFIIKRSGIIGEFKRGTPTKRFKIFYTPEEIALIYEKYNFSAISVVVEKRFFLTTDDDLIRIKNTVSIPVIQKGFVFEESQIIRAKNNGADGVLLIARLLDREKLAKMLDICKEIKIEPIVEIHSEYELDIVSGLPFKILGINNRDLSTLKVDLLQGERVLLSAIKKGVGEIRIIESGLTNPEDALRFKNLGADGFLIGNAFLQEEDIESIVKEFSRRLV